MRTARCRLMRHSSSSSPTPVFATRSSRRLLPRARSHRTSQKAEGGATLLGAARYIRGAGERLGRPVDGLPTLGKVSRRTVQGLVVANPRASAVPLSSPARVSQRRPSAQRMPEGRDRSLDLVDPCDLGSLEDDRRGSWRRGHRRSGRSSDRLVRYSLLRASLDTGVPCREGRATGEHQKVSE